MNLQNYKFVSREVNINETIRGKMRDNKVIMIGVLDKQTGIIYPHPLTQFIKRNYEYYGKSLNSADAPAREVCKFLNYCMDKIDEEDVEFITLKNDGIRGLKRLHGSRYITYLSLKGLQKSTVEQYEKYISAFFVYLKKMNLIEEEFLLEGRENIKGNVSHKSVFREPYLPTRLPSQQTTKKRPTKLKDFGERRVELTSHFIHIAQDIAPDIALGLCFQFYGGLRRGEVVNISRSGLHIEYRESMEVQIKDNRKNFFARLKDTKAENPKRLNYLNLEMSKQTILDNELVWNIYDQHMKRLEIMMKNGTCENTNALFLDSEGYPMSGKVYDRRFQKVKHAFMESLIGHESYEVISNTVWSTHIGRGVFTNTLIDMGFTPTQLAIARGDRNINSALSYIDETLTTEQIKQSVNEFKNYPTERLGDINPNDIKKWKNKV